MAIRLPIVSTFDKKGLDRAKRALKNFGSFAADVGKVAAGAVTAVAVAGVREAAQFESSIAKIEGLVGVGGDALDKLAASARELGPEFGKSANEAADALFFITSAGLRGEGAINVLEASLKGAAIGLGDTKTIADLATSAVNAYGESQLDGAKAVDVLTEAVRLGKLEPAELAGAMGQVLPLASNLGVSFDQVGAALAGMSKTGTDASTASTQLRQILATIAKPTNEANDALAEMGLSAEGLREQIREEGLYATLETLTDAFDGNIEATSEVFGNIRALSGVLDLMGASAEDNREVFAQLADGTGVLDEAFAVAADTAEFKFDKSMGLVKESLLGIGEDLLERLLPYLDRFNTFMEQNGPKIEKAFDKIFGAVEDVARGVEGFVDELKEDPQFQEFIDTLGDNFEDLWPEVKNAAGELSGFAASLTPLAGDTANKALQFVTDITTLFAFLTGLADDVAESFADVGIQLEGPFIEAVQQAVNPIQNLLNKVNDLANAMRRLRDQPPINSNELARRIDVPLGGFVVPPPTQIRTPATAPPGFSISSLERTGAGAFLRRAMGGPVNARQPYIIGERGPELFVPNISGDIIPNDSISSASGGNTFNITVNAGMGAKGPEIGREVINAIRDYERRNGRVFRSA